MQGETAEYSVLSLLASKERVIETLKRELEDKNNALENRKQKEGKLKVQISAMKGMIRPLRDEQVHLLEEMKSDYIEKHRLQSELDAMKIKLEVERMKEEAVKMRGELGAVNEKLTVDQETRDVTMERLENRARKAEEAILQWEGEKLQLESKVVANERRAHELEKEVLQREERAAALQDQLQMKTQEVAQLKKVDEALHKFDEMLTCVKLECAEVKRANKILEGDLQQKQKQTKNLKRKLKRASKSKINYIDRKRQLGEGDHQMDNPVDEKAKVKQYLCTERKSGNVKAETTAVKNRGESDDGDEGEVEFESPQQGVVVDSENGKSDNISESASKKLLGPESSEKAVCSDPLPTSSTSCCSSTATLSPVSFSPLDISGSPPQLQETDLPSSSGPSLRLRDLKSLVKVSPLSDPQLPSKAEVEEDEEVMSFENRIVSLKHKMKHHVELALRKYFHHKHSHVYGDRSWEIFDDEDFAEVCRMLSVQARDKVCRRWELQRDSNEDLLILEEDIIGMRESVDYFFHLRKVHYPVLEIKNRGQRPWMGDILGGPKSWGI